MERKILKNAIAKEVFLNLIAKNLEFFSTMKYANLCIYRRILNFSKAIGRENYSNWRNENSKFSIFFISLSKCIRVFPMFKICVFFCDLPFFMLIGDIFNMHKYFNENYHFGVFNSLKLD